MIRKFACRSGISLMFRSFSPASLLVLLSASLALSGCLSHREEAEPNRLSPLIMVDPYAPLHQHEQEKLYWEQIYRENPEDKNAAINLSKILRVLDKELQAFIMIQGVLELYPDDRDVLIEYGKILVKIGKISESEKIIHQLDVTGEPDPHLLSGYGTLLDRLGRHEEAKDFYDRALFLSPNDPFILNNLAMSFLLSGDLDQAEEIFRYAETLVPSDPQVRNNLALVQRLQTASQSPKKPQGAGSRHTSGNGNARGQSHEWKKIRSLDTQ